MQRNLTPEEVALVEGGLRIVAERCASAGDVLLGEAVPGAAAIFQARGKLATELADLFEASTSVVVEIA